MTALLQVKDLKTRFHTPEGTVYAVNGVSFHLNQGETLAVVGESGCGKSVTMLSVLRLIPIPPGEIAAGSAIYVGRDLLSMKDEELERVRGREISMVFQDPMTSLNPVLTIGRQITETLRVHLQMTPKEANEQAEGLLEAVGIPEPKSRLGDYPHQFSGGMRQRVMIAMSLACNRPGRDHPGADRGAGGQYARAARYGGGVDHPRPWGCSRIGRSSGGHVRRLHR